MDKQAYIEMSKIEANHWWFCSRRKIINKILKSYCSERNSKILEVGSGTGGNTQLLSQFGSLDSVEKNPFAIELAKQKNPNFDYIQCELPRQLDIIENDTYNLIVLLDVIEHIREDKLTLKGLGSKLKKNGMILITAPAFSFLWSQHDVFHHHYRRYSKKELIDLVESADLKISYRTYINFFLFIPVVIFRICHKFFSKNKHSNDELINNKLVNNIFKLVYSLESKFLPHVKLPFGVSHLFVINK